MSDATIYACDEHQDVLTELLTENGVLLCPHCGKRWPYADDQPA